jgi:predicted peptidase
MGGCEEPIGRVCVVKKIESRALTFVPDGPGPHPVLCFLHGAGEAAADRDGQRPQPLTRVLTHCSPGWHAENRTPFVARFLVICPQLGQVRRWEPEDAQWVDALVAHAIDQHGGDASRLALTGFSLGGEGTFQLASASRHRWPVIWAVDPALQRIPPIPTDDVRVWVHHGSDQPGGINMNTFAELLGLQTFRDDRPARRVISALQEDHVGTCVTAYARAQVYDWLAS